MDDKIQKCLILALDKGATEHEALSAFRMARRLSLKHQEETVKSEVVEEPEENLKKSQEDKHESVNYKEDEIAFFTPIQRLFFWACIIFFTIMLFQ